MRIMTISLNHLSIYFFVILLAVSSCSSDDQGTGPNSGITYDDWYWEITLDTITYRCEGTYIQEGSTANDFSSASSIWLAASNTPDLAFNDGVTLAITERNSATWVSGDECRFVYLFENPSNQTSSITVNMSNLVSWGESIGEHLSANGVYVQNSGGVWVVPHFYTLPQSAPNWSSEGRSFEMTYTPSSYTSSGVLPYPWTSEPAIGEANFTLYFQDISQQDVYSANCTVRFKAPRVQF